MMNNGYYYITKKGKEGDIVYFDYEKISSGYNITPKNQVTYDGIKVNKLIIIKQTFVEKLLRRKIKKKLELYLQYIIDLLDTDTADSDSDTLREVLNDLSRYKDILRYKYNKYLSEEYVDLMIKKIELLGYELSLKLMNAPEKFKVMDEEVISRRGM
jgi:hypothetical protein